MGVRANHIELVAVDGADHTIKVESVEQLGAESNVFGHGAGGEKLTVHAKGQTKINAGDEIGVQFLRDKIHLFDGETGVSVQRV